MNNTFFHFVYKEMLHILRDKRTMLIVIVLPVVLMLLFGFAISTELNRVDVAVVMLDDESGNSAAEHPAIRRTCASLEENPYFAFHGFVREQEVDALLRKGTIQVAVVFGQDYERTRLNAEAQGASIKIIVDGSNTVTAQMASAYVQQAIADAVSDQPPSQQQLFSTLMRHNPQMRSAYNFVPGVMGLIFLLICAMMTSISIVREKETGTMEVLLVSPIRPISIVFAKMIPYLLISFINLITILLIARFLMDVPMSGGMVGIVGISLLYLVLALSFGLLISTLAKTQVVAMLVSAVVLMVPVIMLSGMMFPTENLPPVIRELSYIVPARWYIDAIRRLMIEGVPFIMVMRQFLILLGMTAAVLGASLRMFKDKLNG